MNESRARRRQYHSVLVALLLVSCALTYGCAQISREHAQKPTLFTIERDNEAEFEDATLAGLRKWVVANRDVTRLPANPPPKLENLSANPLAFENNRIAIVRLRQTYRNLPVHGDDQQIAVVVVDRNDVVKVSGTFVNEKTLYKGFDKPISKDRATRAMRRHWARKVGRGSVSIDNVRKVALVDSETIAFAGDISRRLFSSSREKLGSILIDAESGAYLSIENRPAEAQVRGFDLDDDPFNTSLVLHNGLPGNPVDNTIHFNAHPVLDCQPPSWINIRMGDATRHVVLSFGGAGGSVGNHFTVGRCSSGAPEESFLGGLLGPDNSVGITIYAQDQFVKTQRALAAIDPLMGSLATHGSAHPYSWNHHPNVPELPHRAPLITVVDASAAWFQSQPGIFKEARISESDANVMDIPSPHPSVFYCQDAGGDVVGCNADGASSPQQNIALLGVRAIHPFQTRTLFHEIGHYYDNYNAYGISGENAEIIAQLFSLYLHRKVYSDLDYTLSTASENASCNIGTLIGHSAGRVVHPNCIDDANQVAQSINVANNGYSIPSFTQAFWSLMFGTSCVLATNSVNCQVPASLATNYEDRWMETLLFALQLGNEQTHVELWNNMALYIGANYAGDLSRLVSVRTLHGLD